MTDAKRLVSSLLDSSKMSTIPLFARQEMLKAADLIEKQQKEIEQLKERLNGR